MTLTPWDQWQHKVNRASLVKDAAAALTGALIVLPQAMAYALIAGLPPQFGLYCAIAPAILAASCRLLVNIWWSKAVIHLPGCTTR